MEKIVDHYKILQVHHDAGQEVIEAAYKRLSKMHHPDVNKSPLSLDKMKAINNAYEIIGNINNRAIYHIEWQNNISASSRYKKERIIEGSKDFAEEILEAYFDDILKEKWEDAYLKLTDSDKLNITLDDFTNWRKSVIQVYRLGTFKIKYLNTYRNCDYADKSYREIRNYTVTILELKIFEGTFNEEVTQKYVAFENGRWKICLGYNDLSPVIDKFNDIMDNQSRKQIAEHTQAIKIQNLIDPALSKQKSFFELGQREISRSIRYVRPLTLITIHLKAIFAENEDSNGLIFNSYLASIEEIISHNIRETDLMGKIDNKTFAILLTETNIDKGNIALGKLQNILVSSCKSKLEISSDISCLDGGVLEEKIQEAVGRSMSGIPEKKEKSASKNQKIGKYNLNDIMGFNRGKMPRI